MYDLIGDLHGHATALRGLLEHLGYRERGGVHRHPERTAVFLGDFVDRGPEIAETLALVRPMVESGAAKSVIGNHELNALAFATLRDDGSGAHCREHTERNTKIHSETLRQLSPGALREALDWFRGLPVALDLGALRVVHACWHAPSIALLEQLLRERGGIDDDAIRRMHREGTPEFDAMELVLKGPEVRLPEGVRMADKEGHLRRFMRVRWFAAPERWTYADLVFPPDASAPPDEIDETLRGALPIYPADAPPVFFGHYWMPPGATPAPLAPNVACLDWSVARGGSLVAYRWDGERTLEPGRFHRVPSGQAARTMPP